MSVQDGTYLIHSSGENIRNFYPVGEYEGAGIGTISGGSRQPPTEWQVQKHPSSDTYTITAKGTRGSWTRSKNKLGDDTVIYSSNPSGWSHHWKFIDIDVRSSDTPIVAIASYESPSGGNLFVKLDDSERLSLEWMQGTKPVLNWIPHWTLKKQ